MIASHIHFFDIDTEAIELYVALIGAVGIVIAAFVNTRKTRKHVARIEENLLPSNGDTLAETIEGNALVLRTLVDGQHMIGSRIDQVSTDLNRVDTTNQEQHRDIMNRVDTVAKAAAVEAERVASDLLEFNGTLRKADAAEHDTIRSEHQEIVEKFEEHQHPKIDPKVGPVRVHKREGDTK